MRPPHASLLAWGDLKAIKVSRCGILDDRFYAFRLNTSPWFRLKVCANVALLPIVLVSNGFVTYATIQFFLASPVPWLIPAGGHYFNVRLRS